MKLSKILFLGLALLFAASLAQGQGTFQNLNFESANVVGYSPPALVPISSALPGWVGYIGNNQVSEVDYNMFNLGAADISLHSSSSRPLPIAGRYSVLMGGQFNPNDVPGLPSAAIAQTGQIPADAKSLIFWTGPTGTRVPTFAGQVIPFVPLQSGPNYIIWGGDISTFAGQTGELHFTVLSGSFGSTYLDNISFSTMSIPEPSIFALTGIGVLLFGIFCRKNSRHKMK